MEAAVSGPAANEWPHRRGRARRSRRRSASPPPNARTRSRSAPRATRSRSPGASCATASTRSPAGLPSSACERGDTLALMLANRPEFHLCDLAGMMLGAAPFSIYNTYTAEQIPYLVADADARILICEQQYLPQVLEARKQLPGARARDRRSTARRPAGTLALAGRRGLGRRASTSRPRSRRSQPTDVLTLIYTSGTTGPAEGRAADPPQPARRLRGARRADRVPARRARDLVAARARTSPSATPTTTCRSSSACRSPAAMTRARCSPTCPKCGRAGSSRCRASGRS